MFAPRIQKPQPKAVAKAAAPARAPVRPAGPARPLNGWDPNARSSRQIASLARGVLQRKLTIGLSNDPLEHEADRVADQVMAGPSRSDFSRVPISIQRHAPTGDRQSEETPSSVDRALATPGRQLDTPLRQDMEARFGRDFAQVRIHDGAAAAQSAGDVGARAYAVGSNVAFGRGQYAPDSASGRWLIAHELAHVVQQQGGRSAGIVQRAPAPAPGNAPQAPDPVLDKVKALLSYGGLDWVVTDAEAKVALALLATIPPSTLAKELRGLEPKYVHRLMDNLPDANLSADVGSAFMFANLTSAAQEIYLANLNKAGKLGPVLSNASAIQHAIFIRPWIAKLTRGGLTAGQRAILRTIVINSKDDALATLKLAAATRFNVTVDKRPIDKKTSVEWNAGQLRQTYLALELLPEAHVAQNKELLHVAQYNQPAAGGVTVVGAYYPQQQMLTLNAVPSADLQETVIHETGHAVDKQLGWSAGAEPAKPKRGGWKTYGADFVSCAGKMIDASAGPIKTALTDPQRKDVVKEMAVAMEAQNAAGLEGNIRSLGWFAGLSKAAKAAVPSDRALHGVKIGLNMPWFRAANGGEHLGAHVYQESYAKSWVRYRHEARARIVAPYQFRGPEEWFAEAYAVYYLPDPGGKGAKLDAIDHDTKVYFDNAVEPLAKSR